jgi:hypothetical protein
LRLIAATSSSAGSGVGVVSVEALADAAKGAKPERAGRTIMPCRPPDSTVLVRIYSSKNKHNDYSIRVLSRNGKGFVEDTLM